MLLLLAALATAPLTGSLEHDRVAAVTASVVSRARRERHIPAVAVSVVQNGRIVYADGFGGANADTRFRIGSVTKTITATAVLQLVEANRLRLDNDVNRHSGRVVVPAAFGEPVTIRELLTHTAGFDEKLARTASHDRAGVLPLSEFLQRELPPRVLPPHRIIQYSNHGYVLLGHVVENTTGLPFGDFVRTRIFGPLAMSRTEYGGMADIPGFELHRGKMREVRHAFLQIGPAADVASTANDMARFMIAQLGDGPPLLQPATLALMHTRQFSQHPALPGVTLGFWESRYFDLPSLYHLGGVRGFASILVLLPLQHAGIFVVNNGNDQALGFEVVDELERQIIAAGSHATDPLRPARTPAPRTLGAYRFLRHGRATVERLALLRRPETPAAIRSDGDLQIGELTFVPAADGSWTRRGSYERAAILGDGAFLAIDTDVLERVPWYDRAALQQMIGVAFALLFAAGAIGLRRERALLFSAQRATDPFDPAPGPEPVTRFLCGVNLMFLAGIAAVFVTTGASDIWFGYPWPLYAVLALPFLSIATAIVVAVKKPLSPLLLVEVGFLAYLAHWNLLGYRL